MSMKKLNIHNIFLTNRVDDHDLLKFLNASFFNLENCVEVYILHVLLENLENKKKSDLAQKDQRADVCFSCRRFRCNLTF